MKDFIVDALPPLNSNPAKMFLAACSSTSADMPSACKSFMKIIRQFLNNFPSPPRPWESFHANFRKLLVNWLSAFLTIASAASMRASRCLLLRFGLRSAKRQNPQGAIRFFLRELPRITRKFFENYSCPSTPRAKNQFTIKFTDNLRTFTFREATPPEDMLLNNCSLK